MQTVYYTTSNFIRHTGNMVDLGEYRRKLALAQQDNLARQPREAAREEHVSPFRPQVITLQPGEDRQARRRQRRERRAWTLDACASLSVVVMTLAFALQVLL